MPSILPKVKEAKRRAINLVEETGDLARSILQSLGVVDRTYVEALHLLKDKHKGRAAFLIGNGPSVKLPDLERLQDEVTFCCNRFYLAYERTTFRPTYTIASDEQTIGDFGQEIVANSISPVILSLRKKPPVNGPFTFVKQRNHRVGFSKNLVFPPFANGASLLLASQLAYWMGMRRFYLYGVDHHYNFQSTGSSSVYHSAQGEGNHFLPNYRAGKAWCPPSVEIIEAGWKVADSVLRSEGGFAKNATTAGKLEVLERITFDDALAAEQKPSPALR